MASQAKMKLLAFIFFIPHQARFPKRKEDVRHCSALCCALLLNAKRRMVVEGGGEMRFPFILQLLWRY